MNKSEFVAAIASRTGGTQADAARFLDAALDEIQSTLAKGGEVSITGFGKFSTSERAARQGRLLNDARHHRDPAHSAMSAGGATSADPRL